MITKIRKDVELMDSRDLEDWIDSMFEHVHYFDLQTIKNVLTREIEKYDEQVQINKIYKICDKCMYTFPEYTTSCSGCGGLLRLFSQVINQ